MKLPLSLAALLLTAWTSVAVAQLPAPARDAHPFPVLEDRDGTLSGALSERRASGTPRLVVYVADRYGEIFRSFDVTGGNPLPLEEVLSWLRFLERLCPE